MDEGRRPKTLRRRPRRTGAAGARAGKAGDAEAADAAKSAAVQYRMRQPGRPQPQALETVS